MNESLLAIVVLTLNEEDDLGDCLAAIPSQYPVCIVDSGSTDATIALAKAKGASILYNPWPGFAGQRNWALKHLPFKANWILFVDADERFPQEFYAWFEKELAGNNNVDAFMVPSFLFFKGKKLRFAPGYPIYHPRLVRVKTVEFVTNHTGHGESIRSGVRLTNAPIAYDHYFYNGGIVAWMHKHVDHALREVNVRKNANAVATFRGKLSVLVGGSVWRIPARFFYHYLLRQGFRDGLEGLQYSLMYAWFEGTKYILRASLESQKAGREQ